jgi:hypothetical protein
MASSANPGNAILKGTYGFRVDRAAANLPQTAQTDYFTITGGRVLITAIIGEVTTVIQTQANATNLVYNPTDAGADQNLCATLDITADAVGTMYSITGTPATTMQDALNFLSSDKVLAQPLVLKPGTIALKTAASNTGATKWTVCYIPIDAGAAVVAA